MANIEFIPMPALMQEIVPGVNMDAVLMLDHDGQQAFSMGTDADSDAHDAQGWADAWAATPEPVQLGFLYSGGGDEEAYKAYMERKEA